MIEKEWASKGTVYEWDMEVADNPFWHTFDNGERGVVADIIDHNHSDRLKFFKSHDGPDNGDGTHCRLVLVRDVFIYGDLDDRQWAYLTEDGEMPERFDDGAKVPVRFLQEFERHKDWAAKFVEPTRDIPDPELGTQPACMLKKIN